MSKSYIAKQNKWLDKHRLKIGSKIKIVRKGTHDEDDWSSCWTPKMDDTIGKTLSICAFRGKFGIMLNNQYLYPYFVLEPVIESIKAQKKTPKPLKTKYEPYKKIMSLIEIREFFKCEK